VAAPTRTVENNQRPQPQPQSRPDPDPGIQPGTRNGTHAHAHADAALEKSGAVVALGTSSSLFRFAFSAAQRSRFGIGKEESGRARPVAGPGRSSPLSAPAYPYPYRRTMSSSSSSAAVPPPPPSSPPPADEGRPAEADDRVASLVDRFLVEALENPRHRLMGTCRAGPNLISSPIPPVYTSVR
jgi:hypothetical protein